MLGTQTLPLYHNTPWLFFFCKSEQLLFLDITLYLLDLLILQLTFLNILELSRIYSHLYDFYSSNKPKVELVDLLAQLELPIISTSN
jgi:hypothetical protein